MFEFILKGGLLIWPILLCSVIAFAVILERLWYFHRIKTNVGNLIAQVKKLLQEGKLEEAEKLCKETRGPVAHILAVGIHIHKRAYPEKEKIISRAGSKELRKLEENLRGLGIVAHISPLLGLLGTVTGMIKCFMKIQELGGRVNASVLAGGIWEALITTAAGLSVAIPAIIFYHYFEGKVDNIASQMKDVVQEFLEHTEFSTQDSVRKTESLILRAED